MTHTPPLSTHTLLTLLDQQLHIGTTLEGLLMAEYSALLGSDVHALAELVSEKRRTAEALERSSLALAEATQGAPQVAVEQSGEAARQCWRALAQLADRLRHQNLANGALLNERQNRLRWVAERASQAPPALYAPRSSANLVAGLSGRSIARA